MRRSRLSYPNSYNHIMNKGINGEKIFLTIDLKKKFLEIINKNKNKYGIKIIAFCIMQNHFHLIVKNEKGKLSEFMKKIEGDFGLYYRKVTGGRGYVFTTRFKSTLIQEEVYLKTAIIYVILNPVRAGYSKYIDDYQWTSYNEYYRSNVDRITDSDFSDIIFQNRKEMNEYIKNFKIDKLNVRHTRFGDLLSESEFVQHAENLAERRKISKERILRRKNDKRIESAEEIINKFLKSNKTSIKNIEGNTIKARELRDTLLCLLRENTTLTYNEIQKMTPFRKLKVATLPKIYSRKNAINAKHRPPDKY